MLVGVIIGILNDTVGYGDGGGSILAGMLGLIFLIMSGFYFGFALPPYDVSFYNTYKVEGQIETIDSAFEGDDGVVSKSFILTVDSTDYFIRSDDQRFRTSEVGDNVILSCNKQFQYFVDPWLDCNFM